jgi:hypothetical protein
MAAQDAGRRQSPRMARSAGAQIGVIDTLPHDAFHRSRALRTAGQRHLRRHRAEVDRQLPLIDGVPVADEIGGACEVDAGRRCRKQDVGDAQFGDRVAQGHARGEIKPFNARSRELDHAVVVIDLPRPLAEAMREQEAHVARV